MVPRFGAIAPPLGMLAIPHHRLTSKTARDTRSRAAEVERENCLRVAVRAALELRIRQLRVRDRELNRVTVVPALEVRAGREHLIFRALVLPHLPTFVVQALAAAEGPERLFTEE